MKATLLQGRDRRVVLRGTSPVLIAGRKAQATSNSTTLSPVRWAGRRVVVQTRRRSGERTAPVALPAKAAVPANIPIMNNRPAKPEPVLSASQPIERPPEPSCRPDTVVDACSP